MKMKSILALVSAASLVTALSCSASAEEGPWKLAAESADTNTQYLVDTSQYDYGTSKHGVSVLSIPVRSVSNGITENGNAVISMTSCVDGAGRMDFYLGENMGRHWWSINGGGIYDKVGASICRIRTAQIAAELAVDEFAKSKPAAVFERVRNSMADAIDDAAKMKSYITLDKAYVIAVNIHYTVSAENYKNFGLSESEYGLLSAGTTRTP